MRNRRRRPTAAALCGLLALAAAAGRVRAADPIPYRPPSVPLVVHNPLFSVWSNADKLTDDTTRHWTKKPQALTSLIRIDGKSYRLMGAEPAGVDPLPQTSVTVTPTRTTYTFAGAGMDVTLQFLTPALPTDLDVLSRPLTYLTWTVKSTDNVAHTVNVMFAASSALAVDNPNQQVEWSRATVPGLVAMKVGTPDQPYVVRNGDDSRIDWGYAYVGGRRWANRLRAIASVNAESADVVRRTTGKLPDGRGHERRRGRARPTTTSRSGGFDVRLWAQVTAANTVDPAGDGRVRRNPGHQILR